MGDCCIICPECGYRECGTNVCPSCGIVIEGGKVYYVEKTIRECDVCGFVAFDKNYYCGCGGVMRPRKARAATMGSHTWDGTRLICHTKNMSTQMDPDVAKEIPFCPFCDGVIETRADVSVSCSELLTLCDVDRKRKRVVPHPLS